MDKWSIPFSKMFDSLRCSYVLAFDKTPMEIAYSKTHLGVVSIKTFGDEDCVGGKSQNKKQKLWGVDDPKMSKFWHSRKLRYKK